MDKCSNLFVITQKGENTTVLSIKSIVYSSKNHVPQGIVSKSEKKHRVTTVRAALRTNTIQKRCSACWCCQSQSWQLKSEMWHPKFGG